MAASGIPVANEDLEPTEDGGLRVVQRRSGERLISQTDPEAQQLRKSRSKVCSGFKIHAFGDAVSGLILSLTVTPGAVHDGTQRVPVLLHPDEQGLRAVRAEWKTPEICALYRRSEGERLGER